MSALSENSRFPVFSFSFSSETKLSHKYLSLPKGQGESSDSRAFNRIRLCELATIDQ